MSDHVTRLQRMAKLKRTGTNLKTIREELETHQALRDDLESWLEAMKEARLDVRLLADETDKIDAHYLPDGAHARLVGLTEQLALYLPGEDSELAQLPEHFDAAMDEASRTETVLDDHRYSAEERDDKWEEFMGAIDTLATSLGHLSVLGVDLEAQAASKED